LLDEIKASRFASETTMRVHLSLAGADVGTRLDFSGWEFRGSCDLTGAIFHEVVEFQGTVFHQSFTAAWADFDGPGNFFGATFDREVHLSFAHSERQSISFSNCTFTENVRAEGVVGALLLQGSAFSGDLILSDAGATVMLNDAQLNGLLDTSRSKYASFQASRLRASAARQLAPMEAEHGCVLTDAYFAERIEMTIKRHILICLVLASTGEGGSRLTPPKFA
jgi:hypothetical protein